MDSLTVAGVGRGPLLSKFSRFLLVGILCTAIQYVVLILLTELLRVEPAVASTLGYALSALLNYALNYSFTFGSSARHGKSLPRFALITSVGLMLNAGITFAGTAIFGVHYLIAQVIATGVTLLWNFAANLRWTF